MRDEEDVEFIDNRPDAFEIGYKKPPRSGRFKKGKSGNPKGRPKRSVSLNKIWSDVFLQPEPVTINGKQHKLRMIEAALMKQREKVMQGDTMALKAIWPHLRHLIVETTRSPIFLVDADVDDEDEPN